MKTFKKGIHPVGNKEISKGFEITEMPAPKVLAFCMQQHIGSPAEPCVAAGDYVKRGQLIGRSTGFISSNIHSSVSGRVITVSQKHDALGNKSKHIVIENDGLYDTVFMDSLHEPTKEQIVERIKEAGIVGMGGAGFPTYVKLMPKTSVDTFIINAAECEPYITCDYRVMLDYTEKFLRGAKLLAAALGLNSVNIGIEDNKKDAAEHIQKSAEALGISGIFVHLLKAKYPQGAEKQLIYAITKKKVPHGGLPSDIGCVVCNVHTALSAYFAVAEGEPLYRRVMTVTGKAVNKPSNLWVPVGTEFKSVIEFCGGESESDPAFKMINGGPMMGRALANENIYSTKTVSCLLLLSATEYSNYATLPCINCCRCSKACPMNLMPMYIDRDFLAGDLLGAKKYGAPACIECGCCSYVCPTKRPLVQSVALAKKSIKEKGV